MTRKPSLDIVMVNWNAGERLRHCLESIVQARRSRLELRRVLVVDNGSMDASLEQLPQSELAMSILHNHSNLGFARACNQGAAGSSADYLLFLNPDTRLSGESLDKPIAFLEDPANANCGVCGIQLVNVNGDVTRSCARFPTPAMIVHESVGISHVLPHVFKSFRMRDWDHGESREVDHVMGAFYLVRRTVFEQVGGFDERFFVYLEDLDLSLRLRRAGHASYYLTGVTAYHEGGGVSQQTKPARLFYSLRSRSRYCHKHFSMLTALALDLVTILVEPVSRLVLAAKEGSSSRAKETAVGFGRFYVWVATCWFRRDSYVDR